MKKFYLMIISVVALAGMLAVSGILNAAFGQTGYLNGHGYVDLGLPSGTLWATCNIGSDTPEGYGDYFAWGETAPKETYNIDNYRYFDGSSLTKYTGFDNLTVLEASDDAAVVNWGAGWRMPTQMEMNELFNNCTHKKTAMNGVSGLLFTGPNGNSIFLPATGGRYNSDLYYAGSCCYYWSSSLCADDSLDAWRLRFKPDGCNVSDARRLCGQPVRAVCPSRN